MGLGPRRGYALMGPSPLRASRMVLCLVPGIQTHTSTHTPTHKHTHTHTHRHAHTRTHTHTHTHTHAHTHTHTHTHIHTFTNSLCFSLVWLVRYAEFTFRLVMLLYALKSTGYSHVCLS